MDAPRAEFRLAASLFVDLVSYSGQSAPPEQISAVITEYQRMAAAVAARWNGFEIRYQADGVAFIFGAPIAFDQDARNAVSAAMEILRRVETLRWPSGAMVRARAGVATGRVHMDIGGSTERFLLTGDSVNLAARLQGASSVGFCLVCEDTRLRVQGEWELDRCEPVELKNVSKDYRPWKVVGRMSRSQEAVPIRTEGRDEELQCIAEWLDTLAPGELLLRGTMGIGKSHLVREAARRADPPWRPVTLRCDPAGQHELLYPLMEWVVDALGLPRDFPPVVGRNAIAGFFARHPMLDSRDASLAGYLLGCARTSASSRACPRTA